VNLSQTTSILEKGITMSTFNEQLKAYSQGERDRIGPNENPYRQSEDLHQFYEDGYNGKVFKPMRA
jgi:hypothetical protein